MSSEARPFAQLGWGKRPLSTAKVRSYNTQADTHTTVLPDRSATQARCLSTPHRNGVSCVQSTAAEALAQIEERGYTMPFVADTREPHRIGCAFDPKTRLLAEQEAAWPSGRRHTLVRFLTPVVPRGRCVLSPLSTRQTGPRMRTPREGAGAKKAPRSSEREQRESPALVHEGERGAEQPTRFYGPYPASLAVMSAAAFLPAPMARMTVAAPVTMSPPAQILGLVVWPVSSSATT